MDLVAQGQQEDHRWRRKLPDDELIVLGRAGAKWSTPWDDRISRRHVRLRLTKGRLKVDQLDSATNPVFYHGNALRSFYLSPNEHFVIGSTSFTLSPQQVQVTQDVPAPAAEQSYQREYLRQWKYRDAEQRIAVLSQLPQVISSASNESDLLVQLVNIVLSGIRHASAAAIVAIDDDPESAATRVLHWDRKRLTGSDFQPSLTLIRKAVETGESVIHMWNKSPTGNTEFHATMDSEGDWAFVTPLTGRVCRGWAIYVAGARNPMDDSHSESETDRLKDDVKFAELVASTLANLRQVKVLERSQASLRSFFSPVVLEAIADEDPDDVLAPRKCDVAVLFCDLRGFSKTSEKYSDNLHELLEHVSEALGVTTRQILAHRGVVGDFHGDAAMGFWGWPLEQPDAPMRACRAALQIQQQFLPMEQSNADPGGSFRIGMGIATGPAVAGKIGTSDQVKVTAFGPVVNLASRLESMTRWFRVPILIDEATATCLVQEGSLAQQADVRKLLDAQLFGLDTTLGIHQLLPRASSALHLEQLQRYERGLQYFVAGEWDRALGMFRDLRPVDEAAHFLADFIERCGGNPPADWQGVLRFDRK